MTTQAQKKLALYRVDLKLALEERLSKIDWMACICEMIRNVVIIILKRLYRQMQRNRTWNIKQS